jgi:hypothetical protein
MRPAEPPVECLQEIAMRWCLLLLVLLVLFGPGVRALQACPL